MVAGGLVGYLVFLLQAFVLLCWWCLAVCVASVCVRVRVFVCVMHALVLFASWHDFVVGVPLVAAVVRNALMRKSQQAAVWLGNTPTCLVPWAIV